MKKVQNIFMTEERKIRDRDQVAVFGGRKEKVCRSLETIDAISIEKIDIRVGMVPVLKVLFLTAYISLLVNC